MRVLVAVFCFCFQTALAQQDTIATRYGNLITADKLKKQLYTLASDEMEGRETATRGQERAAAYIAAQFAEAGLQPGVNGQWLQYYTLYSDSLIHAAITIKELHYRWGRDFWVDVRAGKNQDLQVSSVAYVNEGTEMDYLDLDVKGKVVLMKEASLQNRNADNTLSNRIARAAGKGAAALLIISPQANRFSSLGDSKQRTSGIYKKSTAFKELNIYYITPAMATQLLQLGKKDNLSEQQRAKVVETPVHLVFKKQTTELHPGNVLGVVEGSDKKDEYVFITAHYDHLGKTGNTIFYGADDDASGTSAVIEMAAAFARAKKEGHGPRRTIVFMTVSGEEKGLLGSQHYTSNPVFPLAATVTDLNIDMIGRIDPAHEKDSNYIYLIGDNRISTELRTISETVNNTYTKLQLDYKYNDPDDPEAFYYRSDHYMFAQHGIPIIFYFNGTHADYHQPTDTPDKINYELLARRAKLVFYTAWVVANRTERLAIDGM